MKKGLLLAFGVSASIGLAAQSPKVSGVKKANLTLEQTSKLDAEVPSFYAQANASQRNGQNPTVQMSGTKFSSSRNGFTLLVSQSNCMTANQTLGVAMFTHRISTDWSGGNSGYIQNSWTLNNGTTWDSMATDNDGIALYRYPSGAILNPAGNTSMANAWAAIAGPFTDGAGWEGYFLSADPFASNIINDGTDNAVTLNNVNAFPRIDIASYDDSTVWVTGGLYADDDGTTAAAQMYRGAGINRGKFNGTAVTWTLDSIKPSFHADASGAPDTYTMTHLAFSNNGQIGYAVWFGVQAAASTPETRTFSPIVYKTTDGGATWTPWGVYDFTTVPAIANAPISIPAAGGAIKPWFSMSNGSDIAVDNNGNLHILCAIEWGASDDNDSLGFTWNRNDFIHYIYDVHTTGNNTWDAVLIDSLTTDATTTASIFTDQNGGPMDIDARMQMSVSPSGDHFFYLWADTDPNLAGGENAFPNLFGVGIDWTNDTRTAKKQFTFTDDFYWHYNSNRALVSGSTYTIPSTSSIDRDNSHNMGTTVDHYYLNSVTFDESEFTLAIGISEATASFGSVAVYPNPANENVNLNINLNNNEEVVISIFNAIGQVVSTETRNLSAGANNVNLNTANLEAGVYFVNVAAGNSATTTKLVIE